MESGPAECQIEGEKRGGGGGGRSWVTETEMKGWGGRGGGADTRG